MTRAGYEQRFRRLLGEIGDHLLAASNAGADALTSRRALTEARQVLARFEQGERKRRKRRRAV